MLTVLSSAQMKLTDEAETDAHSSTKVLGFEFQRLQLQILN